ncbi:MAG: hypothetical protein RL414_510 [Actinomycetota bacterium]
MLTSQAVNKARTATTVAFIINGFLVGAFIARVPDFKEILSITDGQLGLTLFCSSIGLLVSLGPTGRLAANHGSSRVAFPATVGLAISTILVGTSQSLWQLASTLFLFGFFLGAQDVSMNAHSVAVEHQMNKRIMSTFHATFSLGALAGGLIGGLLSQLQVSILTHATGVSLLAILLALYFRSWWLKPEIDIHPIEKKRNRKRPGIFWALGLIVMCGQVGEGAAGDWGGILTRTEFGASPFVSTLPYIFFAITMVTGRFFGDRLATRFGAKPLIIASGLTSACGLSGGLLLGGVTGIILGWIFLAAGSSIVLPLIFSTAGKMAKERFSDRMAPSEGMAMVSGVAYFGFLAGPPVIGFLSDLISLRWAMMLPAILALFIAFGASKVMD